MLIAVFTSALVSICVDIKWLIFTFSSIVSFIFLLPYVLPGIVPFFCVYLTLLQSNSVISLLSVLFYVNSSGDMCMQMLGMHVRDNGPFLTRVVA